MTGLEVDKQKNRIVASNAIRSAHGSADLEDFSKAKKILDDAIGTILSSHSGADSFCRNLVEDLVLLKLKLNGRSEFDSGGRQQLLSTLQSHVTQRSTGLHSNIYSTPSQIYTQTSAREYRRFTFPQITRNSTIP
jgi:hypothetical protein